MGLWYTSLIKVSLLQANEQPMLVRGFFNVKKKHTSQQTMLQYNTQIQYNTISQLLDLFYITFYLTSIHVY